MRRFRSTSHRQDVLKNSLFSLQSCVQDLDKQIIERTPYDERMEYFNSNVKDLTTLVQNGIQDYVYLETSNFCDCTDGTEPE